jgi:hypothetical protein
LPSFDAEEESTIAGHFNLRDPRIFRSDRPPAPDLQEPDENEATAVDSPSFEPLTPPSQLLDVPAYADEEPLTTIYTPERHAPKDLPRLCDSDFEPTRIDSPRNPFGAPPSERRSVLTPEATTSSPRPRLLTGPRVALGIYVVAILAQTLALLFGADELAATLLSAWQRWFG